MDPAILYELLERQPRRLPPDRVERRQHDRLGRVVDDEVHTCRPLERADVPSLTTDDPALHVLGREREHGDGRLTRVFGSDALDSDRDDLARTLLALLSRPLLDLTDGRHGFATSLVEHLRLQSVARFLCGHLRDLLETLAVLVGSVLELLPDHLEGPVAVVELLGPSTELVDLGLDCLVLLGEPFLQTLDLLASGAELLLRVLPKCCDLVLSLREDLPDEESDAETHRESHNAHHDRIHRYSSKRKRPNAGPSGPVRPSVRGGDLGCTEARRPLSAPDPMCSLRGLVGQIRLRHVSNSCWSMSRLASNLRPVAGKGKGETLPRAIA